MIRHRKNMTDPMRYALSLAVPLLIPALMHAQVDRSKAPKPGPPPAVQLGRSERSTLANGMHLIVVENHKLPMVGVQVRFDAPPVMQGDLAGYQDLVGELLTSGTKTRTKEQIDEQVDRLGAQLGGGQDGVYAGCLKKNFSQLMELVQDVVQNATYPQEEFEKAKTRALSGIQTRADDPDQIADAVGRALTFGKGHPYGEVPSEKTMGNVSRDVVYDYYQHFFKPSIGYLVFVGDLTAAEAKALAEKHFGSWKSPYDSAPGAQPDFGRFVPVGPGAPAPGPLRVAFVDRPGSAQSVVRVLFPVDLQPNDPMAQASQVLNTILGGGVFNARLMQNLREDKAYTYGAYSSLDPDRWSGSFNAGCSVRNEVTDSAAAELLMEVARIQKEPVTAEELALTKSYMAGSFARSLEDPRTIARFALNTDLNKLPADYYATYLKRLDTVSVATVQAAAQRLLHPANATLLVVGDKAQVADQLKRLSPTGTVEFFDINGDPFKDLSEPAPAGMTAQQVLDAYVKAIGGKAVLDKVKDLKREYSATMQGMSMVMAEYNAAPNKYAMEMKSGPMMLQKIVFDGKKGMAGGMQGKKELTGAELDEAKANAFAFPELHHAELGLSATLKDITPVNGQKAYQVVVKKADGSSFSEFYDVKTGLKVRKTETASAEDGGMQVTTDYGDYKAVDGIQFPHSITQNVGVELKFTASAIAVNKGVDGAVFKMD